jgi:hypothetical protein
MLLLLILSILLILSMILLLFGSKTATCESAI